MKNPLEFSLEAAVAIGSRKCDPHISCRIGLQDGKVFCRTLQDKPPGFYGVIVLRPNQMDNGISDKTWCDIGNKLFKLYMEKYQ